MSRGASWCPSLGSATWGARLISSRRGSRGRWTAARKTRTRRGKLCVLRCSDIFWPLKHFGWLNHVDKPKGFRLSALWKMDMCQAEFDMCPCKNKIKQTSFPLLLYIWGGRVQDRAAAMALAHFNAFQSPDMFPIFCDKLKIEEIRRMWINSNKQPSVSTIVPCPTNHSRYQKWVVKWWSHWIHSSTVVPEASRLQDLCSSQELELLLADIAAQTAGWNSLENRSTNEVSSLDGSEWFGMTFLGFQGGRTRRTTWCRGAKEFSASAVNSEQHKIDLWRC